MTRLIRHLAPVGGAAPEAAGAPALQRCDGGAELAFAWRQGASALAHLYQHDPCRVLFPRVEPGAPPEAVLVTTSGGLAGGDRLRLSIAAGAGAAATVTTQAAEKVYRSLGADCRIDVTLDIGAGALLEWLPQETILFDGARLDRRTRCDIAAGGRLLAVEAMVFGRTARGERFRQGRLHDSWRIRRDGRLAWADGLAIAGDATAVIDAPAALDGATAVATVIHAGAGAADRLDLARGLLDSARCRTAASVVNGVLLARLIGRDAMALRADLMHLLGGLRAALGIAGPLPRVWTV